MNINLGASSKAGKKKKKTLSLGLNVLGDDEDVDDSEQTDVPPSSSRAAVNQALQVEQAALRKRAREAAEKVYDYDGSYETFKPTTNEPKAPADEERKSRYIGELLQAAEKRKKERDIVYERKVAREQAQEEESADFRGKEKFVTAAYRKKLEERELWLAEEDAREREEEANDVTKKTGGSAMASFYGNLNRNVAMGGSLQDNPEVQGKQNVTDTPQANDSSDDAPEGRLSFVDGFEKASPGAEEEDQGKKLTEEAEDPSARRERLREATEEKIKKARERYFKRHNMEDRQ